MCLKSNSVCKATGLKVLAIDSGEAKEKLSKESGADIFIDSVKTEVSGSASKD